MFDSLEWEGPVVWWNPVDGWRHAFTPDERPSPGRERETLCGQAVTLIDPSAVDWLMPTCDTCMNAAIHRRDDRTERHRNVRTTPPVFPRADHSPNQAVLRDSAGTDETYPRWSR